ncbi:hypothetical protein [Singulisphaera sp. PoT]|uniref:hypothetical protein n=1 Tax=Singulisphaera sp. PoT TaxID=3411797 RepID=UPI003BF4F106
MPAESWEDVLDRTRRPAVPATEGEGRHQGAEQDALLPSQSDPYKAAGSPFKGSLTRLACVMGKEGFQTGGKAYRFFQYVHLDSDSEFGFSKDGQYFTLRFAGLAPVLITVRGRNLLRICDQIQLHKIPWIRLADRDFFAADGGPNDQPVITEIRVDVIAI